MPDESVLIVMDGPDMHRDPELELRRGAGHVIVAPNQDAEPVRNGYQSCHRDRGRDDHQCPVAAVLAYTSRPRHVRPIECGLQHLIKRLADVQLDVVVSLPVVEPGNINGEQAAQAPIKGDTRGTVNDAGRVMFLRRRDVLTEHALARQPCNSDNTRRHIVRRLTAS